MEPSTSSLAENNLEENTAFKWTSKARLYVLLYFENNHALLMMGRNLLSLPVQNQCVLLNHLLSPLCRSTKHFLENKLTNWRN